jgi:hypothetical protein
MDRCYVSVVVVESRERFICGESRHGPSLYEALTIDGGTLLLFLHSLIRSLTHHQLFTRPQSRASDIGHSIEASHYQRLICSRAFSPFCATAATRQLLPSLAQPNTLTTWPQNAHTPP